jgi:hypothetical protein
LERWEDAVEKTGYKYHFPILFLTHLLLCQLLKKPLLILHFENIDHDLVAVRLKQLYHLKGALLEALSVELQLVKRDQYGFEHVGRCFLVFVHAVQHFEVEVYQHGVGLVFDIANYQFD